MKKTLRLLSSAILLLSVFGIREAKAQNLDSLYSVWQDGKQPDSIRVSAYRNYIWDGFLFSHPDSALVLAEALHSYAQKHKCPKAASIGYNLQGIANDLQGNYSKALECNEKSLVINEEIGDKRGIASSLNNIGNVYQNQGNYPRALEYFEKSLAINEEFGDKQGISGALANIGAIYNTQGNYPHALEYFKKSLAIDEEIRNKYGIASSLNNIGNVYQNQSNYPRALEYYEKSLVINEEIGNLRDLTGTQINMGRIYSNQHNYPRALENYEKALAILEEIRDKNSIAKTLSNIGDINRSQRNYPLALEYFKKSLAIQKEIKDKHGIAANLYSIGFTHKELGKNTLALDYCQKGLALAEEIGALALQKEACQCLFTIYEALGNSDKALEFYKQMIVARDSMFNEENTKKLVQIDMQYEFDRKEAAAKAEQDKKDAIALQKLKRQKLVRNGFMGGFGVVLLFAGVFFRQRNKIGKEKKRSEELLLNILPAEVAEELKAKGSAEAVQIDQVTVLFTDFKGFTAMSELVSPKELVTDLHACFSEFDHICEKYGIEKIKTIGDAYMAAGGLPTPNTTHARDVVKAALEMAEVIEKGKATKIAAGQPFFEVRIGIHTGPVVAGIVGVKKFQYDIWGDTVNTASRMESSGAVGKVNVSESTYLLLKSDVQFKFESRGKITAKGKGEMEMLFVSLRK